MPARRGRRWAGYAYDPRTRQKRYVGTFDTKKEAAQAEDDWKRKHRRLKRQETCDHFADRWVDDYPRRKASTNTHNRERIKPFAKHFKGVLLADLDRMDARRFALDNRSSAVVARAMFTDAMRDGLVEHNPFANLRLPGSRGRKDIVALTEPELKDLAACAPKCFGEFGRQVEAMLLFAGYVGVRPGELFGLRWEDLDGDLCHVRRAVNRSGDVDKPKNGLERTVIIPPPARLAVESVIPEREWLFVNVRDERWSGNSFGYWWRRIRDTFGRPQFDLYELRHCAATMLLERGVSPWDVAVQLGHRDGGQLVMQVYGHPSEAGARSRLLAAYGAEIGTKRAPTPLRPPQKREQAS